MPIRFRCVQCNQLLSIGTRMAGREITCPKCSRQNTVPFPESDAPSQPQADSSPPEDQARREEPLPEMLTSGPVLGPQDAIEDAPADDTVEADGDFADNSAPTFSPELDSTPGPVLHDDDEEDEGLHVRAPERLAAEMDLIPMVDCVFLILIFYMVTASYGLQKTLQIPPPSGDSSGAVQAFQSIDDLASTSVIVRIDERNTITVDDDVLSDPDALVETLRAKMSGADKTELVVEAHALALHDSVVSVIDAANEVQFQKIRLTTTPGSEPD